MSSTPRAPHPVLLIVSNDAELRDHVVRELASEFEVEACADEDAARAALSARRVDLLLLDDMGGGATRAFEARQRLASGGALAPTVLLASTPGEEDAVEALRRGFVDYVVKRTDSLSGDILRARLATSLEIARLRRENERLRAAIEQSQARLFNVYDSLDDAIMQIDHDCHVVSVNRSAAALANCEPRDAVGKACHEIFDWYPCERREKKESCPIYRTFLEGETIRGARETVGGAGMAQYMTFITTLNDQDYVVYRETDVTEKRRLEEKIANALRSLGVDVPPPSRP